MDWSSALSEPTRGESERAVDEGPTNITSHMPDLRGDEKDNGPPLQLHTLKQFEQHLNDLKKENFSLKLRIYFLEERIQQKYEESTEDVYRSNIELKVEVESLKQELHEKQQLLDKALKTAESLTDHNEAELQRRCQERQHEIDQMQQVLETKIQLLQEEAQLVRSKDDRTECQSQASLLSLDTPMDDAPEEDSSLEKWTPSNTSKDRMIQELTKELLAKEALITELTNERSSLTRRVGDLEGQVQELSSTLLQKDKDVDFYQEELGRERLRIEEEMQSLVEEQQSQLNQYECAAGQCVSELQKAQLQVQSLQAKFHESEANNMKLQEKLSEMESELRSLRQSSQSQERTIQGLNDSINTKDNEAQELYQMIEGQNTTLCKLREIVQRNQMSQSKAPDGSSGRMAVGQLQDELVAVQNSLFSIGLELETSQRSLRQSQRREADLLRFKDRLNSDLQEALQHREVTEKHNQSLHCTLRKTCSELQAKESAVKESEAEHYSVVQEKERAISQLKRCLEEKERQLQEYSEMLESSERCKQRDVLVEKLRERIKERDKALEHSIDEKFHCLEEHEGQVRSLQLALREKERDLERLRCILSNNEDTITSLDSLVHSKDLELEQAAEAYRNLQWLKQHCEEKDTNSLRDRDSIISQLQAAVHARLQETQDLTAALVARVQTAPNEVIEELKARLSLKEKLFQELLSDRSCQSNEHHAQIQDLLNTISCKDQYLQDYSYRMSLVITERTGQLQEIRKQLSLREQELCKLKQDKELGLETDHLKSLLKEKESLFKELIQSQEEPSTKDTSVLQEELQLVLKKEREAREELSALRLSFGQQQAQDSVSKDTSNYQCALDQLLSEYNRLNDALRAEKRLYQSLSQIHAMANSSEKVQALHTELDSVQALRGQLEEVLARTRSMALTLERAAKRPADLGDLSSDEDKDGDDDCSSEEFTDSIEEEDCKETGHDFTSIQASDIQQLEEERTTLEAELDEIQSQLERDGFSSLAHMRSTLRKLQQENCALKEDHNQSNKEQRLSSQDTEDEVETEEEEEETDEEEDHAEEQSPFVSAIRPNTLNLCSHLSDVSGAALATSSDTPYQCWQDIAEDLKEQASRLRADLTLSCQDNRELQERLMVSEATVHAQAEQLKDYRDLLTETSVKQASKHVQVDLQDLGYETCGRSENEAEREDASSPEFDDLEMCTALSQHQDLEGDSRSWYDGNTESYKTRGEPSSLQHLVQDLRSQLTHCHKVIRGLQMRVRSLSATSDYASSLERTPRKVNWALATSPAPSGVEEDEGWMSDPQGTRSGSKRSKELQELMERVASLETQLRNSRKDGKGQSEDTKCATWPGKYNSLIQAQARELSHLRQRIREGQGVCHILSQHLGDTTKTFEELLRSNDIDYYMGQSFREQLSQSTTLAQRVVAKISGRDCSEGCDDKTATLLALRLSKELQQKDKIIESLHSRLQQRAETPSSCHALSETTDQSDRTSLVSDEFRGTEDLDLCSEADGQDYQEGRTLPPASEQSVFPSPYSHRPLKSSRSCPNMLCSAPSGCFAGAPLPLLSFTSPSGPRPRALSVLAVRPELDVLYKQMNEHSRGSFSPADHNQQNLLNYSQLSHHSFQQYQLGGIPEDYSLKTDSGLVTGGTLWDVESMSQPVGSYSGLTGHLPGHAISSQAGMHLIEEHLQEVKCLRQRLEESIGTNERLRQQLEERLASTGREGGAPTNIYIQGLDTVTQLSNEIRVLKEENLSLQSRLQASTGEEVRQLRDAVFTARARLKQAELEAEQWREELRRLQIHSQEQGQQLQALRQERQMNLEKTNKLEHDVSLLQQQLCESRELIHSLQSELQVYDQVCARTKTNKGFLSELPMLPVELAELLGEVRSLRAQLQNSIQENSSFKQLELHKQLEQKLGSPRMLRALTASPQRDSFYRRQLLHDPAPSPPVRDIGLFNCGSPGPPYTDLEDCHSTTIDTFDPHAELEGEAPDGSFANRNGRHVIGHVDDFSALQQQILEGCSLVHQIESTIQSCLCSSLKEHQTQSCEMVLDDSCVKNLFTNTKTLRLIFEETTSLLKMFWRAALPSTDASLHSLKKEQCLQEEILSLKLRVSEQEEVLKGTIQRLRSTSRTKESMEHFIVSQLSRTRDVLKKARTNLELKSSERPLDNGLLIAVS